jgi:outer membrane protein with beta-barrel domain
MMKSARVGLVVACWAAASAAVAQDIEFGIKGGASLADLSGGEDAFGDSTSNTRNGFVVGAFLAFPLGGTVSLQPEALFAQKGAKFDFTDFETTLKIDYVEVPLLIKARFGGDGIRPYLFAGPYFGFRMKAEVEVDAGEAGNTTDDLEDETKGTDYGAVAGAGLEIPAGNGAFLVEARYARGLTSIASDDVETEDEIKNAVWSLLVGFRF